jgi:predicted RNA-binding Zn-ribbon protein involved in translation (DUF1610 family)
MNNIIRNIIKKYGGDLCNKCGRLVTLVWTGVGWKCPACGNYQ